MPSYSDKYKKELEYINNFWGKVIIRPKKRERLLNIVLNKPTERMHKNILNIPKSFITPNIPNNKLSENGPGWFSHIFYWDTYFISRGLLRTKKEWILRSMVDNFTYLYNKYGIIPNFNSPASTGRSQPPLLTSMILDTYEAYLDAYNGANPFKKLLHDRQYYNDWLARKFDVAKKEYENVWIDRNGYYHHRVEGYKLSRYGDRDIGYAHSAELESGWDFTSRFYNRCNEFLPIDLNSFLYKYEMDFAKISEYLNLEDQKVWEEKANLRKKEINKYMWNEKAGFFFDYGFKNKRQSNFLSLAGFVPLWTELATADQAAKMVKKLSKFETQYGLTITAEESLASKISLSQIPERYRETIEEVLKPKQWDYPNIWPPLEYLTVIGLLKYGYVEEAMRIMKNSLSAESKIFRKYGTFFEKMDGEIGDVAKSFHYAQQQGFGWTNAVFYRYVKILDAIEAGQKIYVSDNPTTLAALDSKLSKLAPPYKLSIPH
jgi:alpha,alpha-trehalase